MNLKRVMALVQTVAMVATLTVGITFATTEQTEAADNIQLSSPIEISAQENEEAEYEFSVSETGYYKIYSEICEYEFYGTLYEKVNGEWKMLINDDDTHTNSNFVIKYAFHAGTDYKIKVREAENQQFNATIYVEKWEPDVTGVRSKKIYCNVGDDIELKPYLVVESEQVVEDLGVEGITYKWFMGGDDENIISTDSSYIVKNITSDQMEPKGYLDIGCTVSKNGEMLDSVYFSVNDIEYTYEVEKTVVYVDNGDSVALAPTITDYYGNKVDINDSRFTYKWYQEGNEECISTQPTYNFTGKFDNIATTNIECGVYKDGRPVGYAWFNIIDKQCAYDFEEGIVYAHKDGSAMLAPTIIDSLNNKVVKDPEAEGLTMEWYKSTRVKTGEYEYNYTDPVKVGSGFHYAIDKVSSSDFYLNDEKESAYFEARLYKKGKLIYIKTFEIYDVDKLEEENVELYQIVRTQAGNTVNLVPEIYKHGNYIESDETYQFTWAKNVDDKYIEIENDNKQLVVNVSENDIFKDNNNTIYRCFIYKDGEYIREARFVILSTDDNNTGAITKPVTPEVTTPEVTNKKPETNVPETTTKSSEINSTEATTKAVGNTTTQANESSIASTTEALVASTETKVEKTKATVKTTKNAVKISLKKVKNAKGYEIQISNTKKFKNKGLIKKTVKGNRAIVKKLKGNKKYFVRVRAYKIVNGKKVYGAWTKIQAVKTKK
ncbi:hypothetical protein [Eubacterium sp.]|uniref:hypothetical protein n=1 Tax=Eubacterium sp. TaxID=142586 RepID=UPI00351FF263